MGIKHNCVEILGTFVLGLLEIVPVSALAGDPGATPWNPQQSQYYATLVRVQAEEPGKIAEATAGKSAEESARIASRIRAEDAAVVSQAYQSETLKMNLGLRRVMADEAQWSKPENREPIALNGNVPDKLKGAMSAMQAELKAGKLKASAGKLAKHKSGHEPPGKTLANAPSPRGQAPSASKRNQDSGPVDAGAAEQVSFKNSAKTGAKKSGHDDPGNAGGADIVHF